MFEANEADVVSAAGEFMVSQWVSQPHCMLYADRNPTEDFH